MIRDMLAGVCYVLIGVFFFFYSKIYAVGTALNMGPGYFPGIISGILILLGLSMITKTIIKKWKI